MRRSVISVLIVFLVLCSFTAPSFADSEGKVDKVPKVPEAIALVTVDNTDCRLIDKIGELSVKITLKDDGTPVAEIPVVRVEEADDDMIALWLGYEWDNKIDETIKARMAGFQEDFHLQSWAELKAFLNSSDDDDVERYFAEMEKTLKTIFSNYTIELTGLPEAEDHTFQTETGAMILTSDLAKGFLSLVKDIVGDALSLSETEMNKIHDFTSMIKVVEAKLIQKGVLKQGEDLISFLESMTEIKLSEAEKKQLYEEIENLDAVIAYMKSESYTGTVLAGVYVTCGCPVLTEYEIVHQYFKETNGKMKLVGTEWYGPEDGYYEAYTGDVIKASDYIRCEYQGERYQYIGSYDSEAELWDQEDVEKYYTDEKWWSENRKDQFVIDDEDSLEGLMLRYEIRSADNGAPAPETGDSSPVMLYIALLFVSAAGMMIAVMTRRRRAR